MSTGTKPREPVTILATVEYDRARSTPHDELWRARSDRDAERVYTVRHHIDPDRWTCECVGFTHHKHCRHIARCKRRRKVQWWHALWLGESPAGLRALRRHYHDIEASGLTLGEDERCALDALTLLIGPEEAVAA